MIFTRKELKEKISELDPMDYDKCFSLQRVCIENGFEDLSDEISRLVYQGENPLNEENE